MTDSAVQERMRTFSFGHSPDDITVYVIVGLCHEHQDMVTTDVRRHFYREVMSVKELEDAKGLAFVPRDEP